MRLYQSVCAMDNLKAELIQPISCLSTACLWAFTDLCGDWATRRTNNFNFLVFPLPTAYATLPINLFVVWTSRRPNNFNMLVVSLHYANAPLLFNLCVEWATRR